MAQLLVRKLEESVVKKLRLRAARAGVSVEEEHRRILKGALGVPSFRSGAPKMSFKEWLTSMPPGLTKRDLKRDRRHRTLVFLE